MFRTERMKKMLPEDKQFHIKCRKDDIGKYVILTGDPKRTDKIARYFENPVLIADNREFRTFTGTLGGKKVSVCSTGIGGPSAAIAVEELCRCGAEVLIRVGTCGGINTEVLGGDEVIPTGAIRQEGTTSQYVPAEYPAVADTDVVAALVQAAEEEGRRHHKGIVQSKDSFYGQHSPEIMPVGAELLSKWDAWKKAGVLASEMECSTVFVVGGLRGAKTGAVLHAIWNQEREKAGLPNITDENTESTIRIAVKAIRILSAKKIT